MPKPKRVTSKKHKREQKLTCRATKINDIPPEILHQILANLGLTDKKSCRLVCPIWKSIVEHFLDFSFALGRFTLSTFNNFTVPISYLRVADVSLNDNLTEKNKTLLLTVRKLELYPFQSFDQESLEYILNNSGNVRALKFKAHFFNVLKIINPLSITVDYIRLENLRKLSISITGYNSIDNIKAVFSLSTPSLAELKATRIYACSCCDHYYGSDAVQAFVGFLARNAKNLKHVTVVNMMLPSNERCLIPVPTNEDELVTRLAELNSLPWLRFRHNASESEITNGDWRYAWTLMNSQIALETLQTDLLPPPSTNINFAQIFHQNQDTLKTIHMNHSIRSLYDIEEATEFDCAWMTDLKCLVDFKIITSRQLLNITRLPVMIETLFLSAPLSLGQLRWIGRNLQQLKNLTLRYTYFETGSPTTGENPLDAIDLSTFCEIISFPSLTTLVISEADFGRHMTAIRDYCTQFDGLEWTIGGAVVFMSAVYFETMCTVRIRRD